MATDPRLGRRAFLKSAALGALVIGGSGCKGRTGRRTLDGGSPSDSGSPWDGGSLSDAAPADVAETGWDAAQDSGGLRPPNVLFILADQWRAQALGCAGDVGWYLSQWGYTVDPNSGEVPYYAC
jgi:hypothetical protein